MGQIKQQINTFAHYTLALLLFFTSIAWAGNVDVVDVSIEDLGANRFRINVTLQHADTGWDHYADRWDVLDETGETLGERVLAHPHVNEQPFTRSLSLTIPETVKVITLRGNDSVHGAEGITMEIAIPGR